MSETPMSGTSNNPNNPNSPSNETMLTVSEVATRLRVSDESVYRLVRSGALKALRISGLWRIPSESLDNFIHRIVHSAPASSESKTEDK